MKAQLLLFTSTIFSIVLLLSFLSCNQSLNEKISKIDWVKKNLCDHWIIQLPSGASFKGFGCTNDLKSPGIISFPNDSLQIRFYVFGSPSDKQTDCDFDAIVKWAKQNCSEDICQGDGSVIYKTSPYIDYDTKIAGTIARAIDSSTYLTILDIAHCSNWDLRVIFESLSPYYDRIASEIIKSIEFSKATEPK